jgi:hypothetical protein
VLPQLRQTVNEHPIITTVVVFGALLVLLGLYAMGFTHSSGGITVR